MPFDPSKPFEVVGGSPQATTPSFDPSKPFEIIPSKTEGVAAPEKSPINVPIPASFSLEPRALESDELPARVDRAANKVGGALDTAGSFVGNQAHQFGNWLLNIPTSVDEKLGLIPKQKPLDVMENIVQGPKGAVGRAIKGGLNQIAASGAPGTSGLMLPEVQETAQGVGNAAQSLGEGLTSPAMLTALATGRAVPSLAKPILGAFTGDMAGKLPESIIHTVDVVKNPSATTVQKSEALAGLGFHTLLTTGLLRETLKGDKAVKSDKVKLEDQTTPEQKAAFEALAAKARGIQPASSVATENLKDTAAPLDITTLGESPKSTAREEAQFRYEVESQLRQDAIDHLFDGVLKDHKDAYVEAVRKLKADEELSPYERALLQNVADYASKAVALNKDNIDAHIKSVLDPSQTDESTSQSTPSEAPPVTSNAATTGVESPVTPAAAHENQGASVPLMVTLEMEQKLADLGYSQPEINAMRPEQAQGFIQQQKKAVNRDKSAWAGMGFEGLKKETPVEEVSTPGLPTVAENGELVGMGGAVPGEFENSPKTPSGIKNETVDAERVKRGLPAAVEPARRSFGTVWDEAMAEIDRNPDAQQKLINELRNKPRALTDHEDALLLQRQIDLQNEFGKATRDLAQAHDDGRMDAVAQEKVRISGLSDQLLDLYNIGKESGTETGRGLNARKMMANEDFSLAQMELSKRSVNGGRPLTDTERADIQKLHDKINETQKAYDDYVSKTDQRISDMEAQKAHQQLLLDAAKGAGPKFSADVIRIAKGIVDRWDKEADIARKEIRAMMGRTSAGVDPTLLIKLAKVGRSYLGHAALDFAEFSTKMVEDVGEFIKPHLNDIYQASKKLIADEEGGHPETVRKAIKKNMSVDEKREVLKESIQSKFEEGKTDVSGLVNKLARTFVEQGIKGRDELIDAVHQVLVELDPRITRRETMDAISGYGKFSQLSKDAISVELRDLKGQMQQVGKLEDMQAKKAPQKTGVERREPSNEERRLIQQVNEMKKKGGFTVTDPAKQLKGALDSIKTRLRNQISDLGHQITTKTKIVRGKTPVPYDAEATKLKTERDALKEQFDSIFGKKGLTDEQRVEAAKRAVEKSIAEYDRRIKENDLNPAKKVSTTPVTPELEALRARRDALKEEFEHLQDVSPENVAEKEAQALENQKKSLEKTITEQERRLREGDLSTPGAPMNRPRHPALEQLTQQRDALTKKLAEARKKPKAQKEAEAIQRKLDDVNKRFDEISKKVATGDLSRKPAPTKSATSPELEVARQKLSEVIKQLEKMRRDAKPKKTPEEIALKAMKTRLANRTAELKAKLLNGDFSPRTRKPAATMDAEATRLKVENERVKQEFKKGLLKDRYANRTALEKVTDTFVKWRRAFVLSGPVTLAKLTSAAAQRMVITPAEEFLGGAIGKLPGVREVAARAPREGGFNAKAEAKAITEGFTKGMRDAWQLMKTGKSDLEVLYGKDTGIPHTAVDFIGSLHGALKTVTKRAEFTRSFEKRMEFNIRKGIDVTDPLVQTRIAMEAYKDAQRSIFLQDNRVVSAYKRALRALEEPDRATGKPSVYGKLGATAFKMFLPVVKVPTNIVGETMQYAVGTITGSTKLALALRKGVETLHPEEADMIMRHLKKGSLGAAMMLTGYLLPQIIGGYYQTGRKQDKKSVPYGEIKVGDHEVPKHLLHNPMLENLQIGATIRHVADSKLRKKDKDTQGIPAGIMAAALGLTEEVPFVREQVEVGKLMNPYERGSVLGYQAKSFVVPQGVQWLAEHTDTDKAGNIVKRKPETALEFIKSGVPGLRQNVPKAKK